MRHGLDAAVYGSNLGDERHRGSDIRACTALSPQTCQPCGTKMTSEDNGNPKRIRACPVVGLANISDGAPARSWEQPSTSWSPVTRFFSGFSVNRRSWVLGLSPTRRVPGRLRMCRDWPKCRLEHLMGVLQMARICRHSTPPPHHDDKGWCQVTPPSRRLARWCLLEGGDSGGTEGDGNGMIA